MVLLKITYRLQAHHVADYERIFAERTLPLIREHGIRFWGLWRTLVGEATEYLELFEFDSLAEFDKQWRALMADPRLRELFEVTGPMVEGERLSLLEPALVDGEMISLKRMEPYSGLQANEEPAVKRGASELQPSGVL
jgi:hypothetical protein